MERQPSKLELIRQMVAKSGTWQRASNRWSGTGARRADDGKRAEHGPGWRSIKSQPGVPHRRGAESAFVAVAFFLSTSNSHLSSSRLCAFLSPSSYLQRADARGVFGLGTQKHVRARCGSNMESARDAVPSRMQPAGDDAGVPSPVTCPPQSNPPPHQILSARR